MRIGAARPTSSRSRNAKAGAPSSAGRLMAHRRVLEPARRCTCRPPAGGPGSGAAWPAPAPGSRQVPEGLERSVLPQQAPRHHHDVPRSDGEPVAPVEVRRDVLDAHQEAVLHRVHVDLGGQGAPVSGQRLAHVVSPRIGNVQALPAHQLRPPRHVGVFPVGEEIACRRTLRRWRRPRSWRAGTAPRRRWPRIRIRTAGSGRYPLPGSRGPGAAASD